MNESEKTKKSRQAYYLKNRDKILKKQKENKIKTREYKNKYKDKRRKELRALIDTYKQKCILCGETDLRCLEMHHKIQDDKKYLMRDLIRAVVKNDKAIEEINKCECLCSNCHRKHHHKEFKSIFWKIKYVQDIKSNSKCDCGESYWACLDFHHIKSEDKILGIGEMIRNKMYSIEDIIKEISKCRIMCSNCHRKEHK